METKNKSRTLLTNRFRLTKALRIHANKKGQAAVEFTLVFLLLIIVAWIPADFGLALYTGQIAQNAVREGARIAAADPATPPNNFCTPLSACYSAGNIFQETAVRLPAALLGPSTITIEYPVSGTSGCAKLLNVKVEGQYPFFFYRVLKLVGMNVTIPTITRSTSMRWEHQC
jgi:hypothetical protein